MAARYLSPMRKPQIYMLCLPEPALKNSEVKPLVPLLWKKGIPALVLVSLKRKWVLGGTQNCDLIFENCIVPKENLLR